jgi:phosphinothricin acetyltransferase
MTGPVIRPAILADLPALTGIYNHYVVETAITFDLRPFAPDERRAWFDDHAPSGRHRLLVAVDDGGRCVGYASTSRWRPKAAYDTTVEASVYCHPAAVGRGCGSALYRSLFDSIAGEDVHTIVAGVSLPNPASIRLHERFGFQPVGVFHRVGRKFDRYWDVAWFERPLTL